MPNFTVVLNGIKLTEERTAQLSKAIQRAVMLELADLDMTSHLEQAGIPIGIAIGLPTMGLVATTDQQRLDGLIGELSGRAVEAQVGATGG